VALFLAVDIALHGATTHAFVEVEVVGEYSKVTTDPTVTRRRLEGKGAPMGSRRRLLKGSSGFGGGYSGPSYRSRYGRYSYYGSSWRRRRFGRSGSNVVGSDTVVQVYSLGPIFSTRSAALNTVTTTTATVRA